VISRDSCPRAFQFVQFIEYILPRLSVPLGRERCFEIGIKCEDVTAQRVRNWSPADLGCNSA